MYYFIQYLLRDKETGIYSHLPFHEVTTDLKVAEKWFAYAVKRARASRFNKIEYVKDVERSYMGNLKECSYESGEPGYFKGHYLINLKCYTFNPMEL